MRNLIHPRRICYVLVMILIVCVGYFFLDRINQLDRVFASDVRMLSSTDAGTLPLKWQGQPGEVFDQEFSIGFLNPYPDLRVDLHLYIPGFEQDIDVTLNGYDVINSREFLPWRGPIAPGAAILILPSEWMFPTFNNMTISVSGEATVFGSLSQIYLGKQGSFDRNFIMRKFSTETLPMLVFGAQVLLLFAIGTLIASGYQQKRYIWLLGFILFSLISSLGLFTREVSFLAEILPFLSFCAGSASLFFMGFIISLESAYRNIWIVVMAFALPVLGLLVPSLDEGMTLIFFKFLVYPSIFVGISISVFFLSRMVYRAPDAAVSVLAAGVCLLWLASIQDFLLRFDIISGVAPISTSARLFTMLGLGIYFMLNISRMNSDLESASKDLFSQLQAKELELQGIYHEELQHATLSARRDQQAEMIADLHDGLAGRLSTIVALTDTNKPNIRAIEASVRAALEELRLVIDSSAADGDLRSALAGLWQRMSRSFEHLNIDLHWDMINLPDSQNLTVKQKLSVLHIIQEAVFNAYDHGKPSSISVIGSTNAAGMSVISVENSGGVPPKSFNRPGGHGVLNMSTRAALLNGKVLIEATDTGALVLLSYPSQ